MTTDNYNGWANRSTWLVKLHIDNDSKDINEKVHEIGIVSDTLRQFKNKIYPMLRDESRVEKEQDFDWTEVDFNEIWDAFRLTK